jgi:hypothetical protein
MSASGSQGPILPLLSTYKQSQFPDLHHYSISLFRCTNQASHTLVHCPRHPTHLPHSFSTTRKYNWCVVLHCIICDFSWTVCSLCPTSRSRMTTKTQCTRHHTRHHLSHLPPGPTGIQQPNTIIPTTIVPLPPSPQGLIQPSLPLQQVPTLSTVQNHHYFSHNQTGHLGPASLVSLAHYKNRHSAHQMGPQHVYNQILIAQHTSDLTKAQNKRFAHLLHNLQITYPDAINLPCISVPPIPVTFAEIRSKFTEGPNSVWKNLPHPPIQTDVRGHCYVKISDVIEDFLAHGFLPMQPALHQSPDWVTDLSHAPQIVSGLQGAISRHGQQPFYYVAFKEWQDDYESHYARTERGSVWCKNITVIAEQGTPRHLCTYPIAFSNTDIPHHNLEKKLREDMNRFLDNNSPNLFYSSKLGKQIRVHAAMYVSLADQQERRPVTCTTAGNSNFHARFGYSINFKALLKKAALL